MVYYFLSKYLFINVDFLLYFWFGNIGVILFNLLPFVKLDGYWLLVSLTNVHNLMDKSVVALFAFFADRKTLKEVNTGWKRVFLVAYGGITFVFRPIFWGYTYWGITNMLGSFNFALYISVFIKIVLISAICVDEVKFVYNSVNSFRNERYRLLTMV